MFGRSRKRPRYEGSAADEAEDKRGAKALGVKRGAYERTARDIREDAMGQKRMDKKGK